MYKITFAKTDHDAFSSRGIHKIIKKQEDKKMNRVIGSERCTKGLINRKIIPRKSAGGFLRSKRGAVQ